jgi:hypothetical protein
MRALIVDHLTKLMNNPSNMVRIEENGREVQESFHMRPYGGVKLEPIWDGVKLIMTIIKGGGK